MPARSVCLVTLSLSEAGPGRFGGQVSVTGIYHTIPYHTIPYHARKNCAMASISRAGIPVRFGGAGTCDATGSWVWGVVEGDACQSFKVSVQGCRFNFSSNRVC